MLKNIVLHNYNIAHTCKINVYSNIVVDHSRVGISQLTLKLKLADVLTLFTIFAVLLGEMVLVFYRQI